MPFEVKVESEQLLKQFLDVQSRVSDMYTGLPQVFLDWQREDMHRKYPTIDEKTGAQTGGSWSVTTLVYPRSRKSRSYRPNTGKGTNRKPQRRRVGTARPILRPELVEQLFDRMKDMCREAIEWH